MNIFYLDDDPVLAAQQHCDRHVVKMILETAQILSTVWHNAAADGTDGGLVTLDWVTPDNAVPPQELKWLRAELCGQRIYRPTHRNHPAVKWAAMYGGNYAWLYRLGMALLDEYTYRYGRVHACLPVLRTLELLPPTLQASAGVYCDGYSIMDEQYKKQDVVSSYRNYYLKAKENILIYTRRHPPEWLGSAAVYKEPKNVA